MQAMRAQRGAVAAQPLQRAAPRSARRAPPLRLSAVSARTVNGSSVSIITGTPQQEQEQAQEEEQQQQQQFNWFSQWYPIAVLEDLDKQLPSPAKCLGLDLAIWWDARAPGGARWRAVADRCPHRLAPLSEGIIDAATGRLYCNYHGWSFDGDGKCTSIPQLPAGQTISASRSCVASFPTCEREGLLWVWPDASPAALVESANPDAWPGLAPEIDAHGAAAFSARMPGHKWYARDMPYPWLAAKENAYNDCSHDQVLHHGCTPRASRAAASPIAMRVVDMTPQGYRVREASGAFEDVTRFPCGARRDHPGATGVAYVVPSGKGSCRQFHTFLTRFDDAGAPVAAPAAAQQQQRGLGALLAAASAWLDARRPTWALHLFSHVLIDADIAIQARVDYNRSANDHVYMPAAADAGPAAFMRWLKEFGGGGPPVAQLKDPFVGTPPAVPTDRRVLLDRYNQHTRHCKACRTAHARVSLARRAASVLAAAAAAGALAAGALLAAGLVVAAGGGGAPATAGWSAVGGLAALAALAAGAARSLGQLQQAFEFVDYDAKHVGKQPTPVPSGP